MKIFTLIVTLVSCFIAINDILPENAVKEEVREVSIDTELGKLASLPEELALERSWKEAKKKFDKELEERRNPKPQAKPTVSKPKTKVPTLNINGIEYSLLAVVNAGKSPYILLKSPSHPLKKVELNMDIAPSVKLKEVHNDRILVAVGDSVKEFKLFERKKS